MTRLLPLAALCALATTVGCSTSADTTSADTTSASTTSDAGVAATSDLAVQRLPERGTRADLAMHADLASHASPDLAMHASPDLEAHAPSPDLAMHASPDLEAHAPSPDLAMHAASPDLEMHVAPPDLAMHVAPPDLAMHVAPPDLEMHAAPPDLAMHAAPPDLAPPSPRAHAHRRCAWLFTNEPAALAQFEANASYFDAIHPVWYALNPDGVTVRTLTDADDAQFLATAKAHDVSVIPLVASVDDVAYTRTMLGSTANQTAHIQTLVALAKAHGYDGLDIDYEHLWNQSDAQPIAAFFTAFGAAMHAADKVATNAAPALDQGSSIWSYDVLASSLDYIHVMAYDFHYVGGDHAGPTAPLGWIDAVGAYAASRGHAGQFILGLPNYGVTTGSACNLGECAARCTSSISSGTAEMSGCPYNDSHYGAGTIDTCQTGEGAQYFDTNASLVEKAESAHGHGFGGIGYWKMGGEPSGFFTALHAVY